MKTETHPWAAFPKLSWRLSITPQLCGNELLLWARSLWSSASDWAAVNRQVVYAQGTFSTSQTKRQKSRGGPCLPLSTVCSTSGGRAARTTVPAGLLLHSLWFCLHICDFLSRKLRVWRRSEDFFFFWLCWTPTFLFLIPVICALVLWFLTFFFFLGYFMFLSAALNCHAVPFGF